MMKSIQKILAVISCVLLLVIQNSTVLTVYAAPDRPDVPSTSEETISPDIPSTPSEPEKTDNQPVEELEDTQITEPVLEDPLPEQSETSEHRTAENLQVPDAPKVNNTNDGNIGQDATVKTGDASTTGAITNSGNTNSTSTNSTDAPESTFVNTGNGADSDNSANVETTDTSITMQDNTANLNNSLSLESNTGNNSASKNTASNSTISSGDAHVSGTITNSVNTNLDGAMISEFNVVEDTVGDIYLDFESGCISGCGSITLQNEENGANSQNETNLDIEQSEITFQSNDASVENELILMADTGNNNADKNTGGNSSITTGDAQVSGNILNFLNNNIAGNVIYGVVNIFEDLVGDIIVPTKYAKSFGELQSKNTNNGSNTTNATLAEIVQEDQIAQFNNADIVNNLILDANTGSNMANDNTGGDSYIQTGDVQVDASVVNVANNNVYGQDMWIVLVNEAGNWVGKIFTPVGVTTQNFASNTNNTKSSDNSFTVSNNANGTDSQNEQGIYSETNTTTVQQNNANIVNNVTLGANTGKNSTSNNTNGNNSISTGDADIQLTILNFVNNNIAGGNVFFSVVNVFGNWIGDFALEGSKPKSLAVVHPSPTPTSEPARGGVSTTAPTQQATENNSNSTNISIQTNQSTDQVLGTSSPHQSRVSLFVEPALASGVNSEKLALASTDSPIEAVKEKNSLRLNLAWGILAVPVFLLLRLLRRRFLM